MKRNNKVERLNRNIVSNFKKEQEKNKKSKLVLLVILLILVTSILVFWILTINQKAKFKEAKVGYATKKEVDKQIVEKVRNEDEPTRMKIYLGNIIEALKNKKYEYVYERFDEDYKKKYFPTIEELKNYTENRLPSNLSVSHRNIERLGEFYILTVDLVNSEDFEDKKNRKEVQFVFKEYNFDDFHFSFSKGRYLNTSDLE